MSDTWLVSVGAGRWQISGIRAAVANGISVFAIDGDADAPGFAYADKYFAADIRDIERVVHVVRNSGIKPSGAVSFVSDAGMAAAAALREAYDLPGVRLRQVTRLTNKCVQRAAWTHAALPCPRWSCAATIAEAEVAYASFRGTVIIKPSDSAGSRGVSVVEPGYDHREAVRYALTESRSGNIILEQFISGTEFTVETFGDGGRISVLAVSEKRKVAGSRETVAVELSTPALPGNEIDCIGKLAVKALLALDYRDGPGHTEILRDSESKLWLVEAAGRAGGFMVADGIVPFASNFDIASATALQAVGRDPGAPPDRPCKGFVLRFIPATTAGIVTHLSGFDAAEALGSVLCGPIAAVGDRISGALNDGARLAYLLALGEGRADALALAARAEAALCIEIGEVSS